MKNEQNQTILAGKVPAGYKQTEVGIIPEDWEVSVIENMVNNIIDYRGVTPKKLGMEWGNGEIVALSAGNVKKGFIDFNAEAYKGSEALYNRWMRSGTPLKNDIVFTMEAPLGNVALIPNNEKYILSQRVILLQLNRKLFDPVYVFYFLVSDKFSEYLLSKATGSTAQGIKRTSFEKLLVAYPVSLKEQTAIAEALSDVDSLLVSLEKLIEKKRAIKTGTMQQLLTGKKRLPAFAQREDGTPKGYKTTELGEIPEDWEVYFLSHICDVRDGTHESPKYQDYGVPLVTSKNLVNNRFDMSDISFISLEDAQSINQRSQVHQGDILMSMIGTIGSTVLIKSPPNFCIKNVALFKPKKDIGDYLIYLLQSGFYQDYLDSKLDGGIQKFISLGTLRNLQVFFPESKAEQTAIAEILSDMDAEIEALEAKCAKTEEIKQGMMQELLTGRTRLI